MGPLACVVFLAGAFFFVSTVSGGSVAAVPPGVCAHAAAPTDNAAADKLARTRTLRDELSTTAAVDDERPAMHPFATRISPEMTFHSLGGWARSLAAWSQAM